MHKVCRHFISCFFGGKMATKRTIYEFLIEKLQQSIKSDAKLNFRELSNDKYKSKINEIFEEKIGEDVFGYDINDILDDSEIYARLSSVSSNRWVRLIEGVYDNLINKSNVFNALNIKRQEIASMIYNLQNECVQNAVNNAPYVYAKNLKKVLLNNTILDKDIAPYIDVNVLLKTSDNLEESKATPHIQIFVSKACDFTKYLKNEEIRKEFEKYKQQFYSKDEMLNGIVGDFIDSQSVYFESALIDHFERQTLKKKEKSILKENAIDAQSFENALEKELISKEKFDALQSQLQQYSSSNDYVNHIIAQINNCKSMIMEKMKDTQIGLVDGTPQIVQKTKKSKDNIKFREIDWDAIKRKIKEDVSHLDVLLDQIAEEDILDDAQQSDLRAALLDSVVKDFENRILIPQFLDEYVSKKAFDIGLMANVSNEQKSILSKIASIENKQSKELYTYLYGNNLVDVDEINDLFGYELDISQKNFEAIQKCKSIVKDESNKDLLDAENNFSLYENALVENIVYQKSIENGTQPIIDAAKDTLSEVNNNPVLKNKFNFDIRESYVKNISAYGDCRDILKSTTFQLVYQSIDISNILQADRNYYAKQFLGGDEEYQKVLRYVDREKTQKRDNGQNQEKSALAKYIIENHTPNEVMGFVNKMQSYATSKGNNVVRDTIFDRLKDMINVSLIRTADVNQKISYAVSEVSKLGNPALAIGDRMHEYMISNNILSEDDWKKVVSIFKGELEKDNKELEKDDAKENIVDHYAGEVEATVRLTSKDLQIFSQKILERNKKKLAKMKEMESNNKAFARLVEIGARQYDAEHKQEYRQVDSICNTLQKNITFVDNKTMVVIDAATRKNMKMVLESHAYDFKNIDVTTLANALNVTFGIVLNLQSEDDYKKMQSILDAFNNDNDNSKIYIEGYLVTPERYNKKQHDEELAKYSVVEELGKQSANHIVSLTSENIKLLENELKANNLLDPTIDNKTLADNLYKKFGIIIDYDKIDSKNSLVDFITEGLTSGILNVRTTNLDTFICKEVLVKKIALADRKRDDNDKNIQNVVIDKNAGNLLLKYIDEESTTSMSNEEIAYRLSLYGVNISNEKVRTSNNLYQELSNQYQKDGTIMNYGEFKEQSAVDRLKDKKVSELTDKDIRQLEKEGVEIDTSSSETLKQHLKELNKGLKNSLSKKERENVIRDLRIQQGQLFQNSKMIDDIKWEYEKNGWDKLDDDSFDKTLLEKYQMKFVPQDDVEGNKIAHAKQFKWQLDNHAMSVLYVSPDKDKEDAREKILEEIKRNNEGSQTGIVNVPKETLILLRRQLLLDDNLLKQMDNKQFANYLLINFGVKVNESQLQSSDLHQNVLDSISQSIAEKENNMLEINTETVGKMQRLLANEKDLEYINTSEEFYNYLYANYGIMLDESKKDSPTLKKDFMNFVSHVTQNAAIKGEFISPENAMKDLQRRQQFAVEVKGKVKVHNGEITISLSDIAAERLKSHFIENKEKISRMNNNEFVDYLNKQFNLQITGNLNNIKLNKKFFALLKINENELTNNN